MCSFTVHLQRWPSRARRLHGPRKEAVRRSRRGGVRFQHEDACVAASALAARGCLAGPAAVPRRRRGTRARDRCPSPAGERARSRRRDRRPDRRRLRNRARSRAEWLPPTISRLAQDACALARASIIGCGRPLVNSSALHVEDDVAIPDARSCPGVGAFDVTVRPRPADQLSLVGEGAARIETAAKRREVDMRVTSMSIVATSRPVPQREAARRRQTRSHAQRRRASPAALAEEAADGQACPRPPPVREGRRRL